jgi:nicotinate-nucleotide adenylyltransferase
VQNKKIGLFGGAFDPVHLGHQMVAKTILDKKLLDQIWFVPVFIHPWAKKLGKQQLADYEDRVNMLELAISDTVATHPHLRDRIKVAHFRDVSYAFDILEYFSQNHPDCSFSWIMGSEYLSKFQAFLELHPLLTKYPFFIYPREGFDFEPLYPNMTALIDVEKVKISSTEIRTTVKLGGSIYGEVATVVASYIDKNKLYHTLRYGNKSLSKTNI